MTTLEAAVIGVAFGFILERSGLADCRVLAAQFYGRNMAVFKVMFTAIVTAMLSLFWLEQFGVIEPGSILPLQTYVLPQLLGGILFGAGFIAGGYCPGTACAAAGLGRRDAMGFIGGMFGGMAMFHLLGQPLHEWTNATSGAPTLYGAAGWERESMVVAVTVLAVAGFWGAEWVERQTRTRS